MANQNRGPLEAEAPDSGARGTSKSYIDESCEMAGQLRFEATVHIDGRVEGEIEGQSGVVIGKTGRVRATIESDTVDVQGTVEGDIFARSKITLRGTARVEGAIRSAGIVIEEGAQFIGPITIGSETETSGDPPMERL